MKAFNRLLKNSAGFSMVELMVGGALIAGLGLTASTLFKNQKTSQKSIDHLQELNNFHKNLADNISRTSNCNATFKAFYNQSVLGDVTELKECKTCTTAHVKNDANQVPDATRLYGVGDFVITQGKARNIWKITKLKLVPPAAPADPSKTGVNKLVVTYEMNPEIKKAQGGSTGAVSKEILINARFTDGKFKSCYDMQRSSIDNLSSSVCAMFRNYGEEDETLDGRIMKWNEETQTCEQVSSIQTCPDPGQAIIGIDQNGQVLCLPISKQVAVWDLVTSTKTTCTIGSNYSVQYRSSDQKLIPICTPGISSYPDIHEIYDESNDECGGNMPCSWTPGPTTSGGTSSGTTNGTSGGTTNGTSGGTTNGTSGGTTNGTSGGTTNGTSGGTTNGTSGGTANGTGGGAPKTCSGANDNGWESIESLACNTSSNKVVTKIRCCDEKKCTYGEVKTEDRPCSCGEYVMNDSSRMPKTEYMCCPSGFWYAPQDDGCLGPEMSFSNPSQGIWKCVPGSGGYSKASAICEQFQ